LGLLSVLLAGALKDERQSTKVIAGASLRNDSDGHRLRSDSIGSDNAAAIRNNDRPRVLVCAPSNTAVDELVFRIVTQGILDSDGYRTEDLSVVRIGNASRNDYNKKNKSQVFFQYDKKGTAKEGLSSGDYNMLRVVDKVSLDSIVEDRRRTLLASDSLKNKSFLNSTNSKNHLYGSLKIGDLRKQVLERAGKQSTFSSSFCECRCF
jgi:hypothetical protein